MRLGAAITTEDSSDGTYIDCTIKLEDMELFVIFTLFGDRYYAYSLNSALAPSELYMDIKSDSLDDLATRDEEIRDTVVKLLEKNIPYYRTPGIFNKHRGYVELPVDGKILRLSQKKNYFNLPETK
jgi:hypothetical protein